MPLPAAKPHITAEAVRQDAANSLAFLQVLAAAVPGAESLSLEEVMAQLEHAATNPLGLELLTRAMQTAPVEAK